MIKITGGAQRARQTKPLPVAEPTTPPALAPKKKKDLVPWRERVFLPLPVAAEVSGLSVGSWYRFEREGRVNFRRLGGRTLIATPDVIAIVDSATPWTASNAGAAARARRAELSKANWCLTEVTS
jgi:hypothetical protein